VNETAVRELNILEPYIGQRFSVWGLQGQIIGIVKDFHFNSLHHKIGPIVLSNTDEANYYVVFKAHPGMMEEAVEAAKQVWARFFSDAPFDVIDTEEIFNSLYKDDTKLAKMVSMLGFLSILIACLGLFGLVTFAAETKTKEIGIRKVLGATIEQIVVMLSKEFILLVGIAMLVAFPLAYYWLQRMLQDYAYRISIGWWMFALAGVATVLLTLFTIGWQAVKAATANPVKSIKIE
jgi:ABC-type antimicrobial peptide transport system permease subunit